MVLNKFHSMATILHSHFDNTTTTATKHRLRQENMFNALQSFLYLCLGHTR